MANKQVRPFVSNKGDYSTARMWTIELSKNRKAGYAYYPEEDQMIKLSPARIDDEELYNGLEIIYHTLCIINLRTKGGTLARLNLQSKVFTSSPVWESTRKYIKILEDRNMYDLKLSRFLNKIDGITSRHGFSNEGPDGYELTERLATSIYWTQQRHR